MTQAEVGRSTDEVKQLKSENESLKAKIANENLEAADTSIYMKNWVVHYSRDEDFECASMIAQNLHILMVDGRIMVDFSKYDRVIYVGVERSGASLYMSDYILENTKLNRKKSYSQ